jgi:hypothetical protein
MKSKDPYSHHCTSRNGGFQVAAENEAMLYFSTRIKSPLDAFTATFSL